MCDRINELQGCGKHLFHILDTRLISNIDALVLCKLITKCLWQRSIDETEEGKYGMSTLYIYCNGIIAINKEQYSKKHHNKSICSILLNNWCKHNISKIGSLSYVFIQNASYKLINTSNIHNLRSKTLLLTKDIEELEYCSKKCSKIVKTKQISNCKLTLDNLNNNIFCDVIILIDILEYVVRKLIDINKDKLEYNNSIGLNISRVYITCCGNINMSSAFIKSVNYIENIKGIISLLLKQWIKKDSLNNKNSRMINSLQKECQNTNSLKEVYSTIKKYKDIYEE